MDEDFVFALQLDEELNTEQETKEQKNYNTHLKYLQNVKPLSLVDGCWELIDPVPDINDLFIQFNVAYFDGKLAHVEVKWSSKMTLCAGVCCYEGRGGLCSVKLSQPLLKLRPRKDLVETLLHEMIHAFLFVTDNNKDHDGHGPEFHKHMYRINKLTGTNITVYHSFHDEVNEYRQHWWRCDGPCVKRKPFYGIVKRAMNRTPSSHDTWWNDHQKSCGGKFIKIKEPENFNKKKEKPIKNDNSEKRQKKTEKKLPSDSTAITDWFKKDSNEDSVKDAYDNKLKSNHAQMLRKDSFWNNKTTTSKVKGFEDSSDTTTYIGSSENASSNIHGFKMSALKTERSVINQFSRAGNITGSSTTVGNSKEENQTDTRCKRDAFLNKIEADTRKRKIENDNNKTIKLQKTDNKHFHSMINKNANDGDNVLSNNRDTNIFFDTGKNLSNEPKTNILLNNQGTNMLTDEKKNEHSNKKLTNRNTAMTNKGNAVFSGEHRHSDGLFNMISLDDSGCSIKLVECPACPAKLPEHELNKHLDLCLC